jgi:hypothetical protein
MGNFVGNKADPRIGRRIGPESALSSFEISGGGPRRDVLRVR